MTSIFGGGQKSSSAPIVQPQPLPPPPTVEDASVKAEQETRALRKRRGRASTVLSEGNNDAPAVKASQLLGA